MFKHPALDLLVFVGGASLLLWYAADKIFQGVGAGIAQAISPNQVVPAGSHVKFNNGDETATTQDTDVGTLQANGAVQYTTPNGDTFNIPAPPVPGAFA